MRRIQKVVVGLLVLGFTAGVSPSHAAPARPRAYAASSAARGFLDPLRDLLVAAWGRTGCKIDPLGLCLPGQEAAKPAVPSAGAATDLRSDTGCKIDPFGGCPAGR